MQQLKSCWCCMMSTWQEGLSAWSVNMAGLQHKQLTPTASVPSLSTGHDTDLQRFSCPPAFLKITLYMCFSAFMALQNFLRQLSFSYLYAIIILFLRWRRGWRLHLSIIVDRELSLSLWILLSSTGPTLWLHFFTVTGYNGKKRERKKTS